MRFSGYFKTDDRDMLPIHDPRSLVYYIDKAVAICYNIDNTSIKEKINENNPKKSKADVIFASGSADGCANNSLVCRSYISLN